MSHIDDATKRATILSALKKVQRMASNDEQLMLSAKAKCDEFLRLGYTVGSLRHMCWIVYRDTGNELWRRQVRAYLTQQLSK